MSDTSIQRRFDAALASGPAVAAAIEPTATHRELTDIDRLRGRPFFEAVEQAAAQAAAERPASWIRPKPDPQTIRHEMDAVAQDAESLRLEVEACCPSATVQLLKAETRLEAYLRGENENLGLAITEVAEERLQHPAAGEAYGHAMAMLRYTDAVQYGAPCALSKDLLDENDQLAGTFHLAIMPARTVDPGANRSHDMAFALRHHHDVQPAAGYSARVDPCVDARFSNDHEIGHLIDYATDRGGNRPPGAYGTYLAECHADCFALAMAARRGEDVGQLAEHIATERDSGAVLIDDTDHWTTPVVRAMQARLEQPGAAARLQAMSPAEIMDDGRAVTQAHALTARQFHHFEHRLQERVQGLDPGVDARTATASAAADAAMAGYARARIACAVGGPDDLTKPDYSWEKAARTDDRRHGALAALGDAMARIDINNQGLRQQADARHPHCRDLAGISRDLVDATDQLLSMDERHARDLDGPEGSRRDYVRERARLTTLKKRAGDIGALPDRVAGLRATASVCGQLSEVLRGASSYTVCAREEIDRTFECMTTAVVVMHQDKGRPSARAQGDGFEIPF